MSKNFKYHRDRVVKIPCLNLPWENLDWLKNIKPGKKFKTICVVGMGGSSLGAKALIKAVKGQSKLRRRLVEGSKAKCVFLDNIDPDFVSGVLAGLDPKKTLFLLISKSGETVEVIALAEILFSKIAPTGNFILITDDSESTLGKMAGKQKIPILISPKNVPGRFSVLSIVGLLPAALAGIPIQKILDGAKKVNWRAAYELAEKQYTHYKKGENITVVFPYAESLNDFVDWYIQLLSESIGKSKSVGITAVKAIGARDQHSQLQLFLDGPDDKFYILIPPPKPSADIKIPSKHFTLNELFQAEYTGAKKALKQHKKPFIEIPIKEITPETLGELFFFFELEVAFLGSMFSINIQNQPAVELSKKYAKSLLK